MFSSVVDCRLPPMRHGGPVGEVSAPRSSKREHSGSANQTVWFSLAKGAFCVSCRDHHRVEGSSTPIPESPLQTAPSNQARLVSSPPLIHLTSFTFHHLAFAHAEPPSWNALPPVTKQTRLNFRYPGGALSPPHEPFPGNHSLTKAFLSLYLLYNVILHSLVQ